MEDTERVFVDVCTHVYIRVSTCDLRVCRNTECHTLWAGVHGRPQLGGAEVREGDINDMLLTCSCTRGFVCVCRKGIKCWSPKMAAGNFLSSLYLYVLSAFFIMSMCYSQALKRANFSLENKRTMNNGKMQ